MQRQPQAIPNVNRLTVLIWFIPLLGRPLPLSSPQSSWTELNSIQPEGIRLKEVHHGKGQVDLMADCKCLLPTLF